MKNKKLAIFLVIFVFLVVVVVLSSTVFSLQNVTLQFMSSTNILTGAEADIVKSGKFRYGENVFFSTKSYYQKNMEKSNPYLKVINIETIFPNGFCIHAIERNECYCIKLSNNKYAVVDEELKVLKILDVFQNTSQNAMQIENTELSTQNLSEGDFFATKNNFFEQLFNCFREWDNSYANIRAKVKSVQQNYEKDGQLLVNMRSGVQIVIENSESQLSDKLNLAFSFYDTTTLMNDGQPVLDESGNPVKVDYTKNGIIYILETDTQIYGLYKDV